MTIASSMDLCKKLMYCLNLYGKQVFVEQKHNMQLDPRPSNRYNMLQM